MRRKVGILNYKHNKQATHTNFQVNHLTNKDVATIDEIGSLICRALDLKMIFCLLNLIIIGDK
jgi:hypothetical protein